MSRSAARRFSIVSPARRRRTSVDVTSTSDLAALFQLGPFDRNQLTLREIDQLRNRIDEEGLPAVCKDLEMSQVSVLRVCAGFGHKLQARSAAKIRRYFRS